MNSCEITITDNRDIQVKSHKKLFNSLIAYTDGDPVKALELYSVTLTDNFKAMGIENPTLDNVLTYINEDNAANAGELTVQDRLDLMSILIQKEYSDDIRERFIDAFTVNGYFKVDYSNIRKSGLFTEVEILDVGANVDKIKNLYYKLKNTEESFSSIPTSNIVGTEIFNKENPDDIETYLQENYSNLRTEEEVVNRAYELGDSLVLESDETVATILESYSNMDNQVTYDYNPVTESFEKRKINDTRTRLQQTLSVEEDYLPLITVLDELRVMIEQDYEINNDVYKTYIPILKTYASEVGIDLSGVDVSPNNYGEFSEVIDTLFNMVYDIHNQDSESLSETIQTFSRAYDNAINKQYDTVYTNKPLSEVNDMHIETNLSEYEMFSNHSLIKISENTYRKVDGSLNIDDLYGLLLSNPELLPQNVFSVKVKEQNLDILIEELDNFITTEAGNLITDENVLDDVKKLVAIKYASGSVEENIPSVKGTYEMDINSFIGDFNKMMISNEILNDIFYFSQRGLESRRHLGEYTLRQLEIVLDDQTFKDLVNYAKISGSYSLRNLSMLNQTMDDINTRDYYANNMGSLSPYRGEYQMDQGYYIIKSSEPFIKLRGKLLEQVDDNVYGEVNRNENILNTNLQKPLYEQGVVKTPVFRNGETVVEKSSKINDNTIEFC